MSLAAMRLRSQLKNQDYKRLVTQTFMHPNVKTDVFSEYPELIGQQTKVMTGRLTELKTDVNLPVMILYFHGGALTAPLSSDQLALITKIARTTNARTVVADYPLLGEASGAQILDFAKTALMEVTVNNQPIILLADSAGAWLVKYLWQTFPTKITASILISPWLDWQLTESAVIDLQSKELLLDLATMQTLGQQFWQGLRQEQQQVLTQPVEAVGPIQIIVGGHEMLLPAYKQLVKELKVHNQVQFLEYTAGFHDFVLWSDLPETKKAIQQMANFIKDQRDA